LQKKSSGFYHGKLPAYAGNNMKWINWLTVLGNSQKQVSLFDEKKLMNLSF
jgi:hypothetical protein